MVASPQLRCGFIGLGSQGAPIARRMIDAGFPTTLWARRPESLDPYRDTTAAFAETIETLGAGADHVGVCVVDDNDVQEVCARLIPAMAAGARLAIHATIHPDTCRTIAGHAAARGIKLIDAPVSGGAPAAEAGTLTLMLGGDADAISEAMPVFESFGKLIVHLGDVGAGQHAKLINNTLLAANLGMADAAIVAGEALGIAREGLAELLLASSGRSFAVEVRARMARPASFAHGGRLLAKDVRLLGEVLGESDPAFARLNGGARPFLDQAVSPPDSAG